MKRVVPLSDGQAGAFGALGDFLDAAVVKREEMAMASFDLALYQFRRSFEPNDDYEHVIELVTALEAILTGNEPDTEAISLRLRNRAARLLATESDPAQVIFADLGFFTGSGQGSCTAVT
jgi:hypothetical protein